MNAQTHKESQGHEARGRNSRVGEVGDRMSVLLTERRGFCLRVVKREVEHGNQASSERMQRISKTFRV